MSNLDLRHPEEGIMLRYLDGELPGRKVRQVRSHLEACWQCRAQVEDFVGVAIRASELSIRGRRWACQYLIPL